ncbi:GT2D2 protein, partial [Amia calva]|nr:GT2D2 protein [Amia calva]
MAKKRKVNREGRVFQERWETEYLFVEHRERSMCLICKENLAVPKEFNVQPQFQKSWDSMENANKNKEDHEEKRQKAGELKKALELQQNMFTVAKRQRGATVKASFIACYKTVKSFRSFLEGAFLKQCMVKVCEVFCPEKKQEFENISLSRNTVAKKANELASAMCGERSGLVGFVKQKWL